MSTYLLVVYLPSMNDLKSGSASPVRSLAKITATFGGTFALLVCQADGLW